MTVENIPIRSDLDYYSMTVSLAGIDYRLSFAYNTRDSRWYMSVAQADGTVLVSGTPIVVDMPLLLRFTDTDLPAGYLVATDSTGEGLEPEKDDFGDRVKLVFIPSADL